MWVGHCKEIRKLTFRALALRRSESDSNSNLDSLWQRANAWNVSFRISLRWPIHILNPVDEAKLPVSCYTSHRCSTTVSLEAYPSIRLSMLVCLGLLIIQSYCVFKQMQTCMHTGSGNQIILVCFYYQAVKFKIYFFIYLVVFQRFEHSKKSKKISTYIPFPQQLDMAPFMASRFAKFIFITWSCGEDILFCLEELNEENFIGFSMLLMRTFPMTLMWTYM